LIQETVWLGDTPIATIQSAGASPTMYYIHSDGLNTPRIITRSSDNAVMWRWDSDPFGVAAPNSNPSGLGVFTYNLRFPGQYADAETGTNYNYYRDYDPQGGGYLESDPAGQSAGVNTYAYVKSNPISSVDSVGLDETIIINRTDGRPWLANGPTNGNWGGKCWSGGKYACEGHPMGGAPPTDSADSCYMHHDKCYDSCSSDPALGVLCRNRCDHVLVTELEMLPNDPLKWLNPPRPGTETDSRLYRDRAIKLFMSRLLNAVN
jgi:RHS repeat-associated protein